MPKASMQQHRAVLAAAWRRAGAVAGRWSEKYRREVKMSLDFLLAQRVPKNLILFVFTTDK